MRPSRGSNESQNQATDPKKLRKEAGSHRSLAYMFFIVFTIPCLLGGPLMILFAGTSLAGVNQGFADEVWNRKEMLIMLGFGVFGLVAGVVSLWIGVKCLRRAARLEATAKTLEA